MTFFAQKHETSTSLFRYYQWGRPLQHRICQLSKTIFHQACCCVASYVTVITFRRYLFNCCVILHLPRSNALLRHSCEISCSSDFIVMEFLRGPKIYYVDGDSAFCSVYVKTVEELVKEWEQHGVPDLTHESEYLRGAVFTTRHLFSNKVMTYLCTGFRLDCGLRLDMNGWADWVKAACVPCRGMCACRVPLRGQVCVGVMKSFVRYSHIFIAVMHRRISALESVHSHQMTISCSQSCQSVNSEKCALEKVLMNVSDGRHTFAWESVYRREIRPWYSQEAWGKSLSVTAKKSARSATAILAHKISNCQHVHASMKNAEAHSSPCQCARLCLQQVNRSKRMKSFNFFEKTQFFWNLFMGFSPFSNFLVFWAFEAHCAAAWTVKAHGCHKDCLTSQHRATAKTESLLCAYSHHFCDCRSPISSWHGVIVVSFSQKVRAAPALSFHKRPPRLSLPVCTIFCSNQIQSAHHRASHCIHAWLLHAKIRLLSHLIRAMPVLCLYQPLCPSSPSEMLSVSRTRLNVSLRPFISCTLSLCRIGLCKWVLTCWSRATVPCLWTLEKGTNMPLSFPLEVRA